MRQKSYKRSKGTILAVCFHLIVRKLFMKNKNIIWQSYLNHLTGFMRWNTILTRLNRREKCLPIFMHILICGVHGIILWHNSLPPILSQFIPLRILKAFFLYHVTYNFRSVTLFPNGILPSQFCHGHYEHVCTYSIHCMWPTSHSLYSVYLIILMSD
jgi:hypothetical protein